MRIVLKGFGLLALLAVAGALGWFIHGPMGW
jgi:hypothetical protein